MEPHDTPGKPLLTPGKPLLTPELAAEAKPNLAKLRADWKAREAHHDPGRSVRLGRGAGLLLISEEEMARQAFSRAS